MKPASSKPANHNAAQEHEEYGMPCAEALIASTLALMTGHAQACCADHRDLMAEKTAASLMVLSEHPLMSAGFRAVALRLHDRWVIETRAAQAETISPIAQRALWHTTPELVQ